jgi:tetratricopeptide (TPR) repeat protein
MVTFSRMRRSLLILGLVLATRGAEGRQDPQPVESRSATAARSSLSAGMEAAVLRLKEAREAAAAEAHEETERDARLAAVLKDSTARVPLRVALDRNVVLDKVRITAYRAGVVTLTWPQGEVQYPLALLSDDIRGGLVGTALSKATSRDHFEMGKLLLRGKDYDGAGRCFAAAVRLEPELAASIPDVDRLRRASRLFEGTFRLSGSTLSLRWGFSAGSEAADFQALQGSIGVKPGIGLEVYAPKLALAAVREIPFRDRVRLSILPKETDNAAHLMGIRFVKPDGGAVLIYGALATALKTFAVVRVEDDKPQELLAPTPGAVGNRMTMEFDRGRVVFQVGDRTVWSGNEGGFADVLAVVGGLALAKGSGTTGASALFKEVSLQGEVNPTWMAKKTAGLRDAYASEFSKEYRARKPDAASDPNLSIDPALSQYFPGIREFYRKALLKVAAFRKSQLQEDLDLARDVVEELTRIDATFPPAWYYLGVLEEQAANRKSASEAYERALVLCPAFPEALCGRGRLQAIAGAWTAARESEDRALALKPDLALGQILRARRLWETRDSAACLEATQMARKLSPGDLDIQSSAQQLANVARGPGWVRPGLHQSAHYTVRSDLPTARCRLYAEHLEALRSHYEEVLGLPLPGDRRADVLIFESEEGYFIYNDYTVGSRQEHTLGAFSPWHGQMALFEGVDVQETCRVLSHEGFHQALHSLTPEVPIWFNEGMAEYVGAARVDKGVLVERGGIQTGRLDNLRRAVGYGWQPPAFSRIFLESQADFYGADATLNYAQAWSMVRYFMDGEGGRWKPVMRDYIRLLLAGESGKTAYQSTFAKLDQQQLEAGWLKHYGLVLRKKPPSREPPRPAPPEGSAPPVMIDLLALLGTAEVKPATGWTLKDGVLESSRTGVASLDLGQEPPPEYDWRLSLRRTGGQAPLLLGLQGGGSTFLLRLDDAGTSRVEVVDGLDFANPPSVRPRAALPVGKTVSLVCSVRKAGVSVSLDGEILLEWKGDLKRLMYLPTPEMIAASQDLFLFTRETGFQITQMSVASPAAAAGGAPKSPPPEVKADPARSIALDGELRRWTADEDGRQLMALDNAGNLLLISLAELKILRKVPAGAGASTLFATPGFKSAWVGFQSGGSIVRTDLEKGEIAESIPTAYTAEGLAVVRKVAYCLSPGAGICAVDLADKKDLGTLGGNYYSALAYEVRKERLWGLSGGALIEFDGSKIGPLLKELNRKNLSGNERTELTNTLNGLGKRHLISGHDPAQLGPRIFLDERSSRIFVGSVAVKTDKPETPVGVFRSPAHSLDKDPAVRAFTGRILGRDQILATSPDGKWAASGTHLFNATAFTLRQELPLPTSLVVFSKDSKSLYYYDWVNRAIALLDIEAK